MDTYTVLIVRKDAKPARSFDGWPRIVKVSALRAMASAVERGKVPADWQARAEFSSGPFSDGAFFQTHVR